MTATDTTKNVYYHGTRANLRIGDTLEPGHPSNYGEYQPGNFVYVSLTLDAAIWGAELARGDARQRIYIVEPTGTLEDDPNLTNKRFPGNPTKSYRTRDPLRITGEVASWQDHAPEIVQTMKDDLDAMRRQGIAAIEE